MFLLTDTQDLSTGKEIEMQTESSIYLSTTAINPIHESIAMAYSNQSAEDVPPLTLCNKRSSTWSLKYHG
jgi:hypothetical protein